MPDTALSGIAADEAARTEYDIINPKRKKEKRTSISLDEILGKPT
jgi:hypothetical protein